MDTSNYSNRQLENKKNIFICKNASITTKHNSSNNSNTKITFKNPFIDNLK